MMVNLMTQDFAHQPKIEPCLVKCAQVLSYISGSKVSLVIEYTSMALRKGRKPFAVIVKNAYVRNVEVQSDWAPWKR